jgi:hypothetical protein
MQNEGTIKEYFFKSDDNNDQIYKNTNQNNIDNYNSSSSELERKNDIECYNKVMGFHPNYLSIFHSFIINHTQKLKILVSTKAKN